MVGSPWQSRGLGNRLCVVSGSAEFVGQCPAIGWISESSIDPAELRHLE